MFHNSSQHIAIDYPLANEEDAGDCPIADSENDQYSYNEIGAHNPKSFNRFENSAKRMLGQEYMGFSTSAGTFKHNSPKAGKQIGPMCLSAYCLKAKSRHCQEFDEETRKNIFKSFWNMSWDYKLEFVNKHVSQIPIKRKRVQDSKKQHSFLFKLPHKHESLQVCRSMFLSTLSIKSDMVKGWLHANDKTGDNVSPLLS